MFILGCHLSVTGGYLFMGKTATSIGGNTFQFFPRNPRGSQSAPVKEADALALKAWMQEHDFGPILCHGAYTMNGFVRTWPKRRTCRTAFTISIRAPT